MNACWDRGGLVERNTSEVLLLPAAVFITTPFRKFIIHVSLPVLLSKSSQRRFPTGALFSSTLDQHLQSPTVPISASLCRPLSFHDFLPRHLSPPCPSLSLCFIPLTISSFLLLLYPSLLSLLTETTRKFCYPTQSVLVREALGSCRIQVWLFLSSSLWLCQLSGSMRIMCVGSKCRHQVKIFQSNLSNSLTKYL